MVELDINDIITRLFDLRAYSRELSQRMVHETELPEDAVPYLVGRIEDAYARCEAASAVDKADAYQELGEWLIRSYRYYVCRLVVLDAPWVFKFPTAEPGVRH